MHLSESVSKRPLSLGLCVMLNPAAAGLNLDRLLPESPEANIKESLVTILSEEKRLQIQCLSPKGEFWVCSEANFRMVRNSFQRAKGGLGKRPSKYYIVFLW
jgi:hypothetical protein